MKIALGAGWIGDSYSTLRLVEDYRALINGAVIGLIVALALSGELGGRKKAE